ncbi:hypothetical protein FA15DRAFT_19968 [Coprinopsis marcescibilis]|uniref:Glutamine amidotransferase type-2 domain-containing protein n=1 Tax=Coprinopsis marcescibilis TaxID=230819 RepID=A0A5C3LDB2_COPMA|nr:hypothetical protein FA15DRAFT_19968 [Coprinopsis marcescibilis]
MCGIFVCLRGHCCNNIDTGSLEGEALNEICQDLRQSNALRGPDYQQNVRVDIKHNSLSSCTPDQHCQDSGSFIAEFYASELRLRGNAAIQQPHQRSGSILCWNGEIFDGAVEVTTSQNDGVRLLETLEGLETSAHIRDLFGTIEGPYAFVYYHAGTNHLYFARDPLGRRSLLIHWPTEELSSLLISSVSSGTSRLLNFEELLTDFIYCVDLSQISSIGDLRIGFQKDVMKINRDMGERGELLYAHPAKVNTTIPPADTPQHDTLDIIPQHLLDTVDDFLNILDRSVMLRVKSIPPVSSELGSARLAILFSGGIDSTVLTYLAHRHIPITEPIDLLNVAFENPRKIRLAQGGNIGALPKRQKKKAESRPGESLKEKPPFYVPDRITGLQEVEELRRLCPDRKWNFVEVDVPYEESQNAKDTILKLMIPSQTVMDLSLALALYFASRGEGNIRVEDGSSRIAYKSPARVVLSGLGSDELLGGYGRHRTAFNAGDWKAVIDELQLEIDRIPKRNLGRDDRIISSHGKETRHPFLSLDVVSFLAKLPVHYKLDPRLEVGKGDKTLLRLLAWKLGLVEASIRKKRAMQFGSHSARMDGERRGDANLGVSVSQ